MYKRFLLVAVVASQFVWSQIPHESLDGTVGPSVYMNPTQERDRAAMKRMLPSRRQGMAAAPEQWLSPLSNEERAKLAKPAFIEGKPYQQPVGVHRSVEKLNGRWDVTNDGIRLWRLTLRSPGAEGIRLHFQDFAVGTGRLWIHDETNSDTEVFGPYFRKGIWGDGDFWTDYVLSDSIVIEFEAGAEYRDGDPLPFRITEIAHLATEVSASPVATVASKAGTKQAAVSCNLDVSCYADWQQTARGIARMIYEREGSSFYCSGTLINTRAGTQVPYFLTADHCINDNTQARTLQTFWFYQTPSCNGTPPDPRNVPRFLGSTYINGVPFERGDGTLLRLNEIPNGATFNGYSSEVVRAGGTATGIHHPSGSHRRISFGQVRDGQRFTGIQADQFIGHFLDGGGLTQPGSSGSALFLRPGVIVGQLSHGPKLDESELCGRLPFTVNYGRFSTFFPVIRELLEGAGAGGGGGTGGGSTLPARTLVSGQGVSVTLPSVDTPTLLGEGTVFQIAVPQGSTRLEIRLQTSNNVTLGLYARFNAQPTVEAGRVVADHADEGQGSRSIVLTAASSPGLRAGNYFVRVAQYTTGVTVPVTITATLGAPASGGGGTGGQPASRQLQHGVASTFDLGPFNEASIVNGTNGFRLNVPAGTRSVRLQLRTDRPANMDVDLFMRANQDIEVSGGRIVGDYSSTGDTGEETIVVDMSSRPPLQVTNYFVGLGVFPSSLNRNLPVTVTLTATLDPAPAGSTPTGPRQLVSGQPTAFTYGSQPTAALYNGTNGFQIAVPNGSQRVEIELRTTTPGADVDLYVRAGQEPAFANLQVQADHRSEGPDGNETIIITPQSRPPLQSGTYFIALLVLNRNLAVTGQLTVRVIGPGNTGGGGGTTPTTATQLTSGAPRTISLPAVQAPTLFAGPTGYFINVPQGATRLEVNLRSDTRADIDLFVRAGTDPAIENGRLVSDALSVNLDSNEQVFISGSSLRPGPYYIALFQYTTGVPVQATLTATVTMGSSSGGGGTTPPAGSQQLTPGRPSNFRLTPVTSPTLFSGDFGFRLVVPDGATRVDFLLRTTTPNVDVDLYVRREADVDVANGSLLADFTSEGDGGSETITITPNSNPPLQPGTYYVGFGLFTRNTEAIGTITANVTMGTGGGTRPSGAPTLVSGVPVKYDLPAVDTPTLYNGDYSFKVEVPQGATRLTVALASDFPNVDTDLYVRFGADPELADGEVVADYAAITDFANEILTITPQSRPALRPGTYFISIVLYTTGAASRGSITAIVERGGLSPTSEKLSKEKAPAAAEPKESLTGVMSRLEEMPAEAPQYFSMPAPRKFAVKRQMVP